MRVTVNAPIPRPVGKYTHVCGKTAMQNRAACDSILSARGNAEQWTERAAAAQIKQTRGLSRTHGFHFFSRQW